MVGVTFMVFITFMGDTRQEGALTLISVACVKASGITKPRGEWGGGLQYRQLHRL